MNDALDSFFREIDEELYSSGGTWCAFLVRALWAHPDGLSRHDALRAVKSDALDRGRAIPRTFDDSMQSTFQQHNSGSDVFHGSSSQAIFRFVGNKGEGRWAVNRPEALAWMALNGRASDFVIAPKEPRAVGG